MIAKLTSETPRRRVGVVVSTVSSGTETPHNGAAVLSVAIEANYLLAGGSAGVRVVRDLPAESTWANVDCV